MATWRGLAVQKLNQSKQKYVWKLGVNSLFVGFWTSHVRTQYICIHSARYQNWVCPTYPAEISKLVSGPKPVFISFLVSNEHCPALLCAWCNQDRLESFVRVHADPILPMFYLLGLLDVICLSQLHVKRSQGHVVKIFERENYANKTKSRKWILKSSHS